MRNPINEAAMTNPPRHERFLLLEQRCRDRGLAATVQRRAVLDALLDSDRHPTPEQIFATVRRTVPGISRATVYRGLDLLVDLGLARRTSGPGSQCRYDGKVSRHHHLVCLTCDRMVDLEDPALDHIPLPDRRTTGFDLVDYSIQFRGSCPDCRGRARTSAKGPRRDRSERRFDDP
jgi:Fe2+ or Zn2+ uptake regulation protein